MMNLSVRRRKGLARTGGNTKETTGFSRKGLARTDAREITRRPPLRVQSHEDVLEDNPHHVQRQPYEKAGGSVEGVLVSEEVVAFVVMLGLTELRVLRYIRYINVELAGSCLLYTSPSPRDS